MAGLAFVIFSSKQEEKTEDNKLLLKLRQVISKILSISRKEKNEQWAARVDLYEEIPIYIIALPCSEEAAASMPEAKVKKLLSGIEELSKSLGIDACMYPKIMTGLFKSELPFSRNNSGNELYKAMMLEILNSIYVKRGKKLIELDIAIITGEDKNEVLECIETLSPWVKYLTVLSKDKSIFEKETERLYEDTGLSVRLTEDIKHGLKNVDLIISYASLGSYASHLSIKRNSIMLDYGETDARDMYGETYVIRGVEVELPLYIYSRIDKRVFDYFTRLELTEAILEYRRILMEPQGLKSEGYDKGKKLHDDFIKQGFRLTGFKGRHSVLKIENIRI